MTPTRTNIENIIRESLKKGESQQKEFMLFSRIMIYINDAIINNGVNVGEIIDFLERRVPPHMFAEVDLILIGDHDVLHERSLEAVYENGAVYISNMLSDNEDYLENIIHETAHSLEYAYGLLIYSDKRLENEFLGKRERFYHLAKAEGALPIPSHSDFLNPEHDQGFDEFLYKEFGYEKLNNMLMGLFVSPYAATSLREYFANGVEKYFLGDRNYLLNVSPVLHEKITRIIQHAQE